MEDCRESTREDNDHQQTLPPPFQLSVPSHKTRYSACFIIFTPQCQLPSGVHHLRGTQVEQPCSICDGSPDKNCSASLYSNSFGDLPLERNNSFRDQTQGSKV